jgi:hypothetical protein
MLSIDPLMLVLFGSIPPKRYPAEANVEFIGREIARAIVYAITILIFMHGWAMIMLEKLHGL